MSAPTIQAAIAGLQAIDAACLAAVSDLAAAIMSTPGGSVIVTGMGKCSHVGRKIAATFQSTGTPSAFLHPGEALHGDMGMIAHNDIVLALSNSGETDEVLAVVDYAKRRHHLVAVITGKRDSSLALAADIALVLPSVNEGCPIGRAPMASAIMMMALGDAIAADLMVNRRFTEKQFLELHHGGYLGKTLKKMHLA